MTPPPATDFETELTALAPRMMRQAMGLTRNTDAAADLVQDTLEKALRHKDSFTIGTNLGAWIGTIMRNGFYTGARRSWRSVQMPDGLAESIPIAAGAHLRLELAETLTAISHLPAEQAEALMMAAEGLSIEEAATMLDVAEGTIKSRISRARAALATWFNEDMRSHR